jgi:hypothetical protein
MSLFPGGGEMKELSNKKWLRQEKRRDIAWRRLQSAAQALIYIRTELVKASAQIQDHDGINDEYEGTMMHLINALEETVGLHHSLVSAATWLGYPVQTLLDRRSWRHFIGLKSQR